MTKEGSINIPKDKSAIIYKNSEVVQLNGSHKNNKGPPLANDSTSFIIKYMLSTIISLSTFTMNDQTSLSPSITIYIYCVTFQSCYNDNKSIF